MRAEEINKWELFFFRRGKNVTLLTCLYILEYIRSEKYTDESLIIGE